MPKNQRQFLIDLANSKGLDPFKADTWKVITSTDIIKAKVCYLFSSQCKYSLLNLLFLSKGDGLFNKGRYRQVISKAFPEITFDEQWLQGYIFFFCRYY